MAETNETSASGQRHIPTFTPTMLATFERCPRQYYLKYVVKQRPPEEFSPNLLCGGAAHKVLGSAFEHYRRTNGFPLDPWQRVEAHVPRERYADEEACQADVARVRGWVEWALLAFDGAARVVGVERTFEYGFAGNGDYPAFRLRHTVDLVLEHPDGSIEHLDWKTGEGYRIDALQNATARIVVGQAFPGRTRILSSTAFVASQATRTDELTRDEVKAVWVRMKELVSAISAEQDWLPVSNPLCPWCAFYARTCPLYPAGEARDSTTDWLEGVA